MKNLLFISHTFPYPPNEGIKLPVYHLLKEFSRTYSVSLLSFIQSREEKYIPEIRKYCRKVVTLPYHPAQDIFYRFFNFFWRKLPFNVEQFFDKEMLAAINRELIETKYQVIIFDFLTTAIYRKFINPGIKTILHYHDAMSMLFYRNSEVEKNYLKKIYWQNQYKKISGFEHELQKIFDKIIVVAETDKKWLVEKSGVAKDKIAVIPNGVDSGYFSPQALNAKEDYPSVIFRGIMNFAPNVDACLYFLKEIFPLIRKEVPEIRFYIVGPNPDKKIWKLARNDRNIIITGYVKDIREYILKTTVNVCPMVSGSGIKNKILEAMACGKASVVTPIAAEGVPELKDGENILIASSSEEFARKTVQLLKDEQLRKNLATDARKVIEEKYPWEKIAERFIEIIENGE